MEILNKREKRILNLFTIEAVVFTLLTAATVYLSSISLNGNIRLFLNIFGGIFAVLAISSIVILILIRKNILKRLESEQLV